MSPELSQALGGETYAIHLNLIAFGLLVQSNLYDHRYFPESL